MSIYLFPAQETEQLASSSDLKSLNYFLHTLLGAINIYYIL